MSSTMCTALSTLLSLVSYNVLHPYPRLALDIGFYKRLASSSPIYGTGFNQQHTRQLVTY